MHIITCLKTFVLVVISSQPLDAALKSALKGDLEDVVLALLKTPSQYDAQLLKQAMKVHEHTHTDSFNFEINI